MSHPNLRFYCRLIIGGDILLISTTANFDHEVEAPLLHAVNHGKELLTDWRRHCSAGNSMACRLEVSCS